MAIIRDENRARRSDAGLGQSERAEDRATAVAAQLVGASEWAEATRSAICSRSVEESPVILAGETGTGKELAARLLHDMSRRAAGPFVVVPNHAVSLETGRAVLFGSEEAEPSIRAQTRRRLLETSRGGTLYLAGIEEGSTFSGSDIADILRPHVLAEVASELRSSHDVRLVVGFTSSRSSTQEPSRIQAVAGSGDVLYFKPLCERTEDVEGLTVHFLREACRRLGKEGREISSEALDLMRRRTWNRNVDELRTMVEALVKQARPPCIDSTLFVAVTADTDQVDRGVDFSRGVDLAREVKDYERKLLCDVLRACRGVQTAAAKRLGIKISTLNTKIKYYDIDVRAFKDAS